MGVKELSGPVGIVSIITEVGTASESAVSAARNIAYFAALIAINLAVMNMLPIPALDGGRIFFLLVDAAALLIFRRKVPEKWQAAVNAVCFMLEFLHAHSSANQLNQAEPHLLDEIQSLIYCYSGVRCRRSGKRR